MKLQILVRSLPFAPFTLHWAVDIENADPIAQLSIEEGGKLPRLAYGAGLTHEEDASDAVLAVVPSAARGQVGVSHDGEANRTTAIVGGLLEKTYVEPSPGSWSSGHYCNTAPSVHHSWKVYR